MKSPMFRTLLKLLGLMSALVLLVSGVALADDDLPNPGNPGPYAVGLIQRTFIREASVGGADRVLDSSIWYPAAAANPGTAAPLRDAAPAAGQKPFPVIVFSHGSGAEPDSSTYLTAHLASYGFIVVAPPHPGNTGHDCPVPCLLSNPKARGAFIDSVFNRPGDIEAAFDGVLELSRGDDPVLKGLIDPARAGLLGHSFGGWSIIQVAARDPRFKAAVPMAAGVGPGTARVAADMHMPTMLLAGDADRITPIDQERELSQAFSKTGSPHWFLVFRGAGHLIFSDTCEILPFGCGSSSVPVEDYRVNVKRWVTAFFQRYVAQDDRYQGWMDGASPPDVLELTRP